MVVTFAIVWAWTSFTWFSSAFDTDDWLHRLAAMTQMVGVVVLTLGIPPFFHSLHTGHVDNRLLVAGYVVMRVAMVLLWLRVARQTPRYRDIARRNVLVIVVAQLGWVVLLLADTSVSLFAALAPVLALVEIAGPRLADRRQTLPWHPHHLAERYGLLTIITLGEGVIGTVAALSAAVDRAGGWTLEAVLVVVAGIGLTFGLWWSYFTVDMGTALQHARRKAPMLAYGHFLVLGGLAGVGIGLHVAGYVIEGEAHVGPAAAETLLSLAVAMFFLGLYGVYTVFVPEADLRHIALVLATLVILGVAVALAASVLPLGWSLLVAMLAPLPTVLGYEAFGHEHQRRQMEALARRSAPRTDT